MAKTKANPQSETSKLAKTQHEPPTDNAANEKLHSLKSLNAMLLKETVERRQQVDSLTQANTSLESELNRCISDNFSLKSDLNALTERAVRSEIESGVASRFVEIQVVEMAEVYLRERVAMVEKIGGLERELNLVMEEKSEIERVKNKKELEIGSLNSRLSTLEGEIGEEKFILSRVSEERDAIRAQLEDRIRIESALRSKLAEAEKREKVVLEQSRKIKVDYDGLVKEKASINRKMNSILREKDSMERNLIGSNVLMDGLKMDIKKINEEKMMIEHERDLQQEKKNELQNSVDLLNEIVDNLQQGKTQLLKEVDELEKNCVVSSVKEAKMSAEIDVLVKEKQESIQRLTEEKNLVTKDLDEALKNVRIHKLTIDQLTKETAKINDAKNQAETDIVKLKEHLKELNSTVKTLEKLSVDQTDKIKQLESENSRYIAASDQATKERNSVRVSLDGEKHKVKNLSEKISNLEKDIEDMQKKLSKMQKDAEKLVSEKKDLENTRAVLENDILVVKKSLAKTQKEHDDTKGKLRLFKANTSKLLKILKNTSSMCNSKEDDNMGMDQETEFGEEIKHHVREVEAIKKAFNDKESIMDEMKKQLDLLKVRVTKADKGKSFWTMVSSATTILAAVSLAYVARGGY
ncbi:hypothetical protein L1987_05882 [Smallanthus sonchifolius]|uniref:Uncharacterized protein n=1 Tax=Smallanthus sonchifolius TaxID=185202 RepID=A0ACB9JWR7_9ASTR|nr:hypothetical protein L1987_05882 [Smallanthus sonchifolius]